MFLASVKQIEQENNKPMALKDNFSNSKNRIKFKLCNGTQLLFLCKHEPSNSFEI